MSNIVKENEREFELSGILEWHKRGYTGKGIKIANMESCNLDAWCHDGKIIDPFNNKQNKFENSHGNQTANILHQVAPDSKIYILNNGGVYINGKVEGKFIEESIPHIINSGISLVNASLGGVDNDILNENIRAAQEEGVTFCTSAGNGGYRDISGYSNSGVWIAVGAVHLSKRNGINIAEYSSKCGVVDFVQFSGIYANDIRPTHKDRTIYVSGTSFSSPMLCGMLALVQQLFQEKAGQTLNQDELYQFMLDNSIDLGKKGKDIEYGHGLFILPNPDEIDMEKYINQKQEEVDDNMDFKDVKPDNWFYKAVNWAAKHGIMKGYKDGTFRPNQPMTRAEYAQAEYNKKHKQH
ncbi:S8 family peptidase [Tissierella praeacuta]|uniref:S8 family peptidase n=1 Tax=Tissierella praeacuta TaxID=43131 RepID=UPI002FDA10A1